MNKSIKLIFLMILSVSLAACGESSNNENTNTQEEVVTLDPNEVLDKLTFSFKNDLGKLEIGDLPFSDSNSFPSIVSFPDLVKTNKLTSEKINLIFDVEANIEEIYLTIAGASGYYSFIKDNGVIGAKSESVSINIDVPPSIQNGNFCANFSVKDGANLLSNKIEVCFSVTEKDEENRVIYLANFSSNSTLSTLDFDTGEIVNIGPTGFQLTDIAFVGDKLYGTNFYQLVSINLDSGAGTLISAFGFGGVNALEGNATTLFAGTTDGNFLTIDPDTGIGTVVNSFGSGAFSSGDFVFDGNMEKLFGSLVVPGSSTDEIVTIDPSTGLTSFIGETGFNNVFGLAFFRNQLLGLTSVGELIIIDEITGRGTLVEDTQAFSAGGAAAIRK